MTDYKHHRCSTCRHMFVTPASRYEPQYTDCGREDDLEKLYQIRVRAVGEPAAAIEMDGVGDDADCPLWAPPGNMVCDQHGVYNERDGCEACMYDEIMEPAL